MVIVYLSESNINRKMFRNHDHTYAKIQETDFDYVSRKFEITSLCDKNRNQMSELSTDAQQDVEMWTQALSKT